MDAMISDTSSFSNWVNNKIMLIVSKIIHDKYG
jgi:hypothetical protein